MRSGDCGGHFSTVNYIACLTRAWIEPYFFVSSKQKSPPGISSADSRCELLRVYTFISVQVGSAHLNLGL